MNYEEKIFRKKDETYLVCRNEACKHAQECLRRMLSDYVPATRRIVEFVNEDYVASRKGQCEYYRSAEPIVMHMGLKKFYDMIPEYTARKIRKTLICDFGSSNYYRYRNGQLLITPDIERHIKDVCRRFGWSSALVFDEIVQEYEW